MTINFLILLILFTTYGLGNEWNGIKILKSTKSDVERILDRPTPPDAAKGAAIYETKHGRVFVRYSVGGCDSLPSAVWNVPEETVIGITVHPSPAIPLSKYKFDKKKFVMAPDTDILHLVEYKNLDDGIVFVVDTTEEVVVTVRYFPATNQKWLKCRR